MISASVFFSCFYIYVDVFFMLYVLLCKRLIVEESAIDDQERMSVELIFCCYSVEQCYINNF